MCPICNRTRYRVFNGKCEMCWHDTRGKRYINEYEYTLPRWEEHGDPHSTQTHHP